LLYTALLFFLIGLAGRMKMEFHLRAEIASMSWIVAAVLASLGVILFLFSFRKRRG
jgi:hypothetical protein